VTAARATPAAVSGRPASSGRPVAETRAGTDAALSPVARCWMNPPHVWLEVHDDEAVLGAGALEQELEVVEEGPHGGGVLQIGLDGRPVIAGRAAGRRLADLVVDENRRHAMLCRLSDVGGRELAVRVPARPAAVLAVRAGVDAAGEVLVAEAERGGGLHRGGAARIAHPAELERRRPAGRQGRQRLGRRGTGERHDARAQQTVGAAAKHSAQHDPEPGDDRHHDALQGCCPST
jgi:hypothetical protein